MKNYFKILILINLVIISSSYVFADTFKIPTNFTYGTTVGGQTVKYGFTMYVNQNINFTGMEQLPASKATRFYIYNDSCAGTLLFNSTLSGNLTNLSTTPFTMFTGTKYALVTDNNGAAYNISYDGDGGFPHAFGPLFNITKVLSGACSEAINQHISGMAYFYFDNGTFTPPITQQINISFYNQSPSDITSTTLFSQNVLIQYNISNRTSMTNAVLQYKVNHNDNCYGYTNSSCTFLNNTYYNSTTYTNSTDIYNWSLAENIIYHSNKYLNDNYFNQTHSIRTLTGQNQLYKIKYLNFSLADNLNYFEIMATSTGTTNVYYCNSSYTTGNPTTSVLCSQIFQGTLAFNHSHNQFSNHTLIVFSQNSSAYIGNVKATTDSYFILKSNTGVTTTVYTIPNSTGRNNSFEESLNNGVSYTDYTITETANTHIHQFSLTDDFIYRGCMNKSGTFECTSERTERIDESIFKPVGVQITSPNASTYQQYINITYIISQHPNTPVVNNSYVNITLFNSTGTKIAFIIKNNLSNSYYWNAYFNNITLNQSYYLQFNITDTYNQTTTTTSDLFNFSTDSYINVSAKNKAGTTITNFSINATDLNTSETVVYNSVNNLSYVQTIQGHTYNLTIDATGYAIESYTKTTPQRYNNHTFNLYTTNSFNISFYDEVSLVLINYLNLSLEIISDTFAQNYSTSNGTLYFDLISPDSYVFRYKSKDITDYPERTYYVTLNDREHIDLNLYLINTTTEITINIKDQDDNIVSDAYVKILRYDIISNTYTIREIVNTNVNGNAYFNGILNTEYYKFVIEYPFGVEVETTNPDYLRSTSLTLRINLEENPLTTYYNRINMYGTLTFNNNTNNFNFYYNDASNTATQGCLYVYKYVGNVLSTTNTSCTAVGTSTGTILLGVLNTSGVTYVAVGTVVVSGTEYILKPLTQTFDTITSVKTKNNFFFLTIILTAIISLLFLWNITIALIVTPLPIFLMSLTGMIPINRSVGITLFLIGITLAVVISKKA